MYVYGVLLLMILLLIKKNRFSSDLDNALGPIKSQNQSGNRSVRE